MRVKVPHSVLINPVSQHPQVRLDGQVPGSLCPIFYREQGAELKNPIMHTIGVKMEKLKSNHAHNRKMTERKVSQASLENLKLGATTRRKGKVRVTVTILPETKEWLAKGGNVSERIDEVVRRIIAGELVKKSD